MNRVPTLIALERCMAPTTNSCVYCKYMQFLFFSLHFRLGCLFVQAPTGELRPHLICGLQKVSLLENSSFSLHISDSSPNSRGQCGLSSHRRNPSARIPKRPRTIFSRPTKTASTVGDQLWTAGEGTGLDDDYLHQIVQSGCRTSRFENGVYLA
jgi:hypothetical protein